MCKESKPLFLRSGRGLGWRLVGRRPSASTWLVRRKFRSMTALATQSNSSKLAAEAVIPAADHRLVGALPGKKKTLRRAGMVRAFASAESRTKVMVSSFDGNHKMFARSRLEKF